MTINDSNVCFACMCFAFQIDRFSHAIMCTIQHSQLMYVN